MEIFKNEHGGVKLITLITILLVIIIGLLGYVVYMHYSSKNNTDIKTNNNVSTNLNQQQNQILDEKIEQNTSNQNTTNQNENVKNTTNQSESKKETTVSEVKVIKKLSPSGFAGSSANEIRLYNNGDVYHVIYNGEGYTDNYIKENKLIAKNAEDIQEKVDGEIFKAIIIKGKNLKIIDNKETWIEFSKVEVKEEYTQNLSDAQNGKVAFSKLVDGNELKTEQHSDYYTYIDQFENKYNIKSIINVSSEKGIMGVDNWAALFKVTVTYLDNNNQTKTMDLAIVLLNNYEVQNNGTYLNYTGTTNFVKSFTDLYSY